MEFDYLINLYFDALAVQGIFNPDYLESLRTDVLNSRKKHEKELYTITEYKAILVDLRVKTAKQYNDFHRTFSVPFFEGEAITEVYDDDDWNDIPF